MCSCLPTILRRCKPSSRRRIRVRARRTHLWIGSWRRMTSMIRRSRATRILLSGRHDEAWRRRHRAFSVRRRGRGKNRPALVIQSDRNNQRLANTIVAMITRESPLGSGRTHSNPHRPCIGPWQYSPACSSAPPATGRVRPVAPSPLRYSQEKTALEAKFQLVSGRAGPPAIKAGQEPLNRTECPGHTTGSEDVGNRPTRSAHTRHLLDQEECRDFRLDLPTDLWFALSGPKCESLAVSGFFGVWGVGIIVRLVRDTRHSSRAVDLARGTDVGRASS